MSFRTEKKALFNIENINLINSFIFKNNLKEIYQQRVIKSLYFDTLNYDCFFQSDEGVVPRKKIRIRSYAKSKNKKIYLEKKISSIEGRYKETDCILMENAKNYISNGIYQKDYGYLYPVLQVKYIRRYFKYKEWRITLDEDIEYLNFQNNHSIKDTKNVIEFKSLKLNVDDELIFDLPFNFSRFSKYCNGIRMLAIL